MPPLRSTRPSRTSSPFVSTANGSPVPSLEPQKEKVQTLLTSWVEPQPRAPVPSFEEHGFQRGGVVENMQPLGVLPAKKLRDRVKSRALRKSALSREEYLKFEEGTSTTPEGTPPIDPPVLEPEISTDTAIAMMRNRDEEEDGDYKPSGLNGNATRSGKLPAKNGAATSPTKLGRPTLSQASPTSRKSSTFHSVFDAQTLSTAVEAAATQTDLRGMSRLGRALRRLFEESQHDNTLAALFDAILLRNPTDEQLTQFQAHIKRIKKHIKTNDKISRLSAKSINKPTMPELNLLSSHSPSTTIRVPSIKARQSLENILIPSSINKPSLSPGYSSETSASPISPIPRLSFPFANGIDTDMVDWDIQTRAARKRAAAGSSSTSVGPSTAGNSPSIAAAPATSAAPSSAVAQQNDDTHAKPSTKLASSRKTRASISRKSKVKKSSNAATPALTDAESSAKADERGSNAAFDMITSAGPSTEVRANEDPTLPSAHSSLGTIPSLATGSELSSSQSVNHSTNHTASIHVSSEGTKRRGRKGKAKAVSSKNSQQSIPPFEDPSHALPINAGSKRKADEADLDTEGETVARRQGKYRENHERLEAELQMKKAAAAQSAIGKQVNAECDIEESNIRNEKESRRTNDLQGESQLAQIIRHPSAASQTPISSGLSSPPSEVLRDPSETPSIVAGPSMSAPSRKRQLVDTDETENDSIDFTNTQSPGLHLNIQRATRGNRASKRHKPNGAQTKLSEMHGGKTAPKVYAGVSPRKGGARSRRPTPDPDPQIRDRTEPDNWNNDCDACGGDGNLICCEKCTRVFHFICLDPPRASSDREVSTQLRKEALEQRFYCQECEPDEDNSDEEESKCLRKPIRCMHRTIPLAFGLEPKTTDYFDGVKAGRRGEYKDQFDDRFTVAKDEKKKVSKKDNTNKKKKPKSDDDESDDDGFVLDPRKIADYCSYCQLSNFNDHRELRRCDYPGCEYFLHTDCMIPPPAMGWRFTNFKKTIRLPFYCQNHSTSINPVDHPFGLSTAADGTTPMLAHKIRRPRNPVLGHPDIQRGFRNNGNIEIKPEEEKVQVVELPDNRTWVIEERIIKIDFIDKIKKIQAAKRTEDEKKQFEARVEAEVQRRMDEFFVRQTAVGQLAQLTVDEQNAVAALMMGKPVSPQAIAEASAPTTVAPQMSTEVTTEASKTTDITVETSKPTDATLDTTTETSKTMDVNPETASEASKTKDVTPEIGAGGSTNANTAIDLTHLMDTSSSNSNDDGDDDTAELYSRD